MTEIKMIISRLEKQKAGIDRAIAALREISDGGSAGASERAATLPLRKKRRLSAEGRRRIVEAARRRWAAINAEQTVGPTAAAVPGNAAASRKGARKMAPSVAPATAA